MHMQDLALLNVCFSQNLHYPDSTAYSASHTTTKTSVCVVSSDQPEVEQKEVFSYQKRFSKDWTVARLVESWRAACCKKESIVDHDQ